MAQRGGRGEGVTDSFGNGGARWSPQAWRRAPAQIDGRAVQRVGEIGEGGHGGAFASARFPRAQRSLGISNPLATQGGSASRRARRRA